jgi:uncharacterized protein (TIGR02996 family)
MREALLRAILEDPADDLPRLAYADWLEEAGADLEMRIAELIRVQVELAGLPGPRTVASPGVSPRDRLMRREADLLNVVCPAGPGPAFHLPGVDTSILHRGFVEKVSLPLEAFMKHAAGLFAHHPLQAVHVTDRALRVEIDPPGEGHDWQAYTYTDFPGVGDTPREYGNMSGWTTREQMVAALPEFVSRTLDYLSGAQP